MSQFFAGIQERAREVIEWIGYKKTPSIQQVQQNECGAASLGIILANLGKWVSINELRQACGISRDGCTALDIQRAAKKYGLATKGMKYAAKYLHAVKLPAIIFWKFEHFCVLEGLRGEDFLINDPVDGHQRIPRDQFIKSYTGIVLEFEKLDNFQESGRPPRVRDSLWPWFYPHRKQLIAAIVCGLVMAIPTLGVPILFGIFVDAVAADRSADALGIVGLVAIAGLLLFALAWLQNCILFKVSVRVSIEQSEKFISTLLRLPVDYFAQRFAGDIASRTQLIDNVTKVGSTQLISLLIEFVISVLLLAWLIYVDAFLACVILLLGVLNVFALRAFTKRRLHENVRLRQEHGRLFGVVTMAFSRLESVKASGRISAFFARCTGYQARELTIRQRFGELGASIAVIPTVVQLLGAAVVLHFGTLRVLSLEMTIGDLLAFFFVTTRFLTPFSRFVDAADRLTVLGADLQRIDDVVTAESSAPLLRSEQRQSTQKIAQFRGSLQLTGRLDIRNLSFGYRLNADPLFSDFNLTIQPGQRIAVIGPSGSGKSTLAALVAGLRQPWSGEILFDGCNREDIPTDVMVDSVAFVDQHVALFSTTVRDNLTMWNPQVPDALMIAAAKDACIHEEIVRRPLAYDSQVKNGGSNFSGGQRQRLEIARALLYNPTLLILDEATSDLDPVVEHEIDDAIRRRGCACLVIAHRLSTIRDCDEIVVLDRQGVAQRGRHEDLLTDSVNDLYRQLVVNE